MKNYTLEENFSELKSLLKDYLDARVNLFKLFLLEKIAKVGTYFLTAIVFLVLILFVILFSTFAFSFWYGNKFGNLAEGFLISAGFYVLLALAVFLLRRPLFTNSIIKNISSIIFSENKND